MGRLLILGAQAKDFALLLTLQSLNRFDRCLLVGLHVVIPGVSEFLELVTLNGLDLKQLVALLYLHAAQLAVQFVRSQLLQFVLGAASLNVVHLLLRLVQIVFQELEELHCRALRSATYSFLGRKFAEFFSISLVLNNEECVKFWSCHIHLSGNIGIFLSDFAIRIFCFLITLGSALILYFRDRNICQVG